MAILARACRAPPAATACFQPGDVVKLHRPSSFSDPKIQFFSYALYCGRGHVIHAWSNSRANFRVRTDSLRLLASAGLIASDTTASIDAFCTQALGVSPLPSDQIVARARQALHCATSGARSTLALILHARYGTILKSVAKSLFALAPLLARISGQCDLVCSEEVSFRDALATLLNWYDKVHYPWPQGVPNPSVPRHGPAPDPRKAISIEQLTKDKSAELADIKSILRSDVEPFISAWATLMLKSKPTDSDDKTNALAVPVFDTRLGSGYAILAFSITANQFTLLLQSDCALVERLVRERLECGICFINMNDLRTKLFQCSHVLCSPCYLSLHTPKTCPFCRTLIAFTRDVNDSLKAVVNHRICDEELAGMASNDVDAPPCEASGKPTTHLPPQPAATAIARQPLGIISEDLAKECDEAMAMAAEDFNALAI